MTGTTADETSRSGIPARGTRPRNRRQLIVAEVTELFYRHGYEQVAMSDVAVALNVSPSALYRHFPSKPELLVAAIMAEIGPVQDTLRDCDSEDLPGIAERLAVVALRRNRLGALWQRESRSLPGPEHQRLREEVRYTAGLLTALIRARRPDLSAADADMFSLCTFFALCSTSYRPDELPRPAYERLLAEIVRTILTAEPTGAHELTTGSDAPGLAPVARRERILAAAIALFAERGYTRVSMEQIGARAGIAGPSIYHHFASKQQLLAATLHRGHEWVRHDMYWALRRASTPADGLRRLLTSYIDFTVHHCDNMTIMLTEARHLDDTELAVIKQTQRDYISEWLHLMFAAAPALSEPEAKIRLHAVLGVANDIARTPHLRTRPRTLKTAADFCAAILLRQGHS